MSKKSLSRTYDLKKVDVAYIFLHKSLCSVCYISSHVPPVNNVLSLSYSCKAGTSLDSKRRSQIVFILVMDKDGEGSRKGGGGGGHNSKFRQGCSPSLDLKFGEIFLEVVQKGMFHQGPKVKKKLNNFLNFKSVVSELCRIRPGSN